ncbi:MAG: PH domain-containing protein [bacterium]
MAKPEENIFVGHPLMVASLGWLILLVAAIAGGIYGGLKGMPQLYWLAGIAIIVLIGWWLVLKTIVYRVTTQRVMMEEGLLGRKMQEVDIRDIRSMEVEKGVLGMMFNFGDLLISTAGQGGIEITFKAVTHPVELKEKVHQFKIQAESTTD